MTLRRQVFSIVWKCAVSPFQWKCLCLLLLVNVWNKTVLQGNSASHLSVPLSITYHDKYLAGQFFQRLHKDDWLQCLTTCASIEGCISYNFNPKLAMCELNNAGITELSRNCEEEKSLVFFQGWMFQRIRDTDHWTQWQQWGPCSATCGRGLKRRMRVCVTFNDGECNGPEKEEKECNPDDCVDISQFCVGKEDGNYPDVTNCHRFIMCSGQLTYITNCPAALVYDSFKDKCIDSSDSSGCGAQ